MHMPYAYGLGIHHQSHQLDIFVFSSSIDTSSSKDAAPGHHPDHLWPPQPLPRQHLELQSTVEPQNIVTAKDVDYYKV